jgi:hypothetical protein
VLIDASKHAGRRYSDQAIVRHHHQIRPSDDAALVDRLSVRADIGEDRRSSSLGAVAGRILHLEAFGE